MARTTGKNLDSVKYVRLPQWVVEALEARATADLSTISDLIRLAVMRTYFLPTAVSDENATRSSEQPAAVGDAP